MGLFGAAPLPLDSGDNPAQDVASEAAGFTPTTIADNTWNWLKGHEEDLAGHLEAIWGKSHILESTIAFLFGIWGDMLVYLLKAEFSVDQNIVDGQVGLIQKTLPIWERGQADIGAAFLGVLGQALGTTPGPELNFGSSPLASVAQSMFSDLVQRFTLVGSGIDLTKPGSGIEAQQYLLAGALNLALMEWMIDTASSHVGLGFLKDLQPFLWVIDRSLNPSNIVRQAVESSYALLLKAPLTRDLNRAHPIKDLGLTTLAKLYVRGAIDQATYLDRCLDSGLDTEQANQLILESAKLLSPSDLGTLLQHGLVTGADALKLMQQNGYDAATANALLSIQTNSRYWSIAERVGNEAVTAWKGRHIDTATLEAILKQTGFSDQEINLLELEANFTKGTIGFKALTYSQVKSMYEANLVSLDYVLNFLDLEGYSPQDANNLVLLDFTAAAERQARNAELIARLRVTAADQGVIAAADLKKNETALATARQNLANELNSDATTLGALEALPSILALIGSLP